jgi:sugar phosphate permease
MAASAQRRTDEVFRVWQRRIFVTTWVTYGSLYLGRVNLAAASKALEMDFGWSNVAIGLFGSVYAATHAVGQFANGWIADRVGARRLLTAGIFTAAAAQILFATRPGYAAMLALWAVNAYAMATGWPSCLKTLAAWFPAGARGTVMGWWSTCYQVGGVAGTALAGFLIGRDPTLQANRWPLAFLVPGCVLLLFAAHFALRTRDDPCAAGLSPPPAPTRPPRRARVGPCCATPSSGPWPWHASS